MLVLLWSAGAVAQPDRSVGALIEQLDSPGFVERELATDDLLSLPEIALADLEAALTVDDLSLEQRRRLTRAARLRFLTEPRAAMGITLGPVNELGLQINGTTRGFDASNKLQAEDVITSIDGVAIRSLADLQVSIVANEPGAVVPVQYIRGGAAAETQLMLGSWRDLPQAGVSPQPEVLELAWLHRSRDYRSLTEPGVVRTLGTPQVGAPSGLPGGSRRGIRRDKPVAGGEARDGAARAVGIDVGRRLSPRLDERGTDFAGLVASTVRDLEARAQQKRDRIARLERDLERARQRGESDAVTEIEARRERLFGELGILLDQIARYREQMESGLQP